MIAALAACCADFVCAASRCRRQAPAVVRAVRRSRQDVDDGHGPGIASSCCCFRLSDRQPSKMRNVATQGISDQRCARSGFRRGDCASRESRLNEIFQQIWQRRNAHKRSLATVHTLRRCTVQCSVCHAESHNLREYSTSAVDARNRKTIQTQYLCGVCRIVLLINPKLAAARSNEAMLAASRARRVA